MLMELFLIWHCVDVANCQTGGDLSNIAATYIGIIAGFVLGGIISWWIYNRQEKTAVKQQEILDHIVNLEEKHEHILEKIQLFEQNHDEMLNNILTLDKKINSLLENK
jgi:Na+/glutamate symporter